MFQGNEVLLYDTKFVHNEVQEMYIGTARVCVGGGVTQFLLLYICQQSVHV